MFELARPLWRGNRGHVAILWTIAAAVLALLATLYAVMLSMVQKMFWNCLNTKNVSKFQHVLLLYALAVIIGPILLSMFSWVKNRLALMWRSALTRHFMGLYFEDFNFYQLSLGGDIDNPDQRISEDVMKFTTRAVRFFTISGVAVFDLAVFSVILYNVYSPLFYILIVYSIMGTLFITFAGRRLISLNRHQVTREADFRFGLVRVRDTTESVAFYAGEAAEKKELQSRFAATFRNNISLLALTRNVDILSLSFKYYAQIIPVMAIAPQYFAGNILLGTISQVMYSFNHVLSSFGLVVAEFTALAEFAAGVRRLTQLNRRFESPQQQSSHVISTHFEHSTDANTITLSSLSVLTPTEPPRPLVKNLSLKVASGERLLVVGQSGIGKSSLMRAICGLWKSGQGNITRPSTGNTLFLPQRPFIMLGSLRENVAYPKSVEDVSDTQITDALTRVNLKYLVDAPGGLDAPGEQLSRRLSLGEQQRLAFARIIISKPNLVVLDESTSALDLQNERDLYGMISQLGITCISVSNRPSLVAFHDRILRLHNDGGWTLPDSNEVKLLQKGSGEGLDL